MQVKGLEKSSGCAIPAPVADFLGEFGGLELQSLSIKVLSASEARRLMDNWLRYGFSCDRGYVPIAEDEDGDLYCVACSGQHRGQVFHVAWAGAEAMRFPSLDSFAEECAIGQGHGT